MICGVKLNLSRGVASVAIRSLAIAAESLSDRAEQDEVLSIFERIQKETGWRIQIIFDSLKKKWQRNNDFGHSSNNSYSSLASSLPPPPKAPPQGIVNPSYVKADFSLADHPYQNIWVPPIQPQVQQVYSSFH